MILQSHRMYAKHLHTVKHRKSGNIGTKTKAGFFKIPDFGNNIRITSYILNSAYNKNVICNQMIIIF